MALKWKIWESRDSEIATSGYAGFFTRVQDCDGDRSVWEVRESRDGQIIAQGETGAVDPYHWYFALDLAEHAVRTIAKARSKQAEPAPQPASRSEG